MGSSNRFNSATDVSGVIGPTPDEPSIVTCGGASRAILISNRSCSAFTRMATGPSSSAMMKIPFTGGDRASAPS